MLDFQGFRDWLSSRLKRGRLVQHLMRYLSGLLPLTNDKIRYDSPSWSGKAALPAKTGDAH